MVTSICTEIETNPHSGQGAFNAAMATLFDKEMVLDIGAEEMHLDAWMAQHPANHAQS